jgi:hypothetical protein
MGIFSFFFKKKIVIEDPFWGKMTYMEVSKDPNQYYFECEPYFLPAGKNIEAFVTTDPSGPTTDQRLFFQNIQANYPIFTQKIIPFIEKEFQNWKPGIKIVDFSREFSPISIDIPRLMTGPVTWTISFDSIHDKEHSIELEMLDFEPVQIT